jgi:radical SAM protein
MRPATHLFDTSPFLVIWELTQACDLACKHCRACAVPGRDPRELTTDQGKRLLDEVRELGAPVVVFTGGDPAKRPDLVELVRHGSSIGLRVALTPSATPLVTEDLLAELQGAGLSRLAVSLDAVTRRGHDLFRGVDGSYDRTFDILRAARRLGLTTQVNTTITRFNVHDLERFAESVEPLGIELWSVFLVVPTGRATEADIVAPEVVEDVLERLAAIAETAPFDVKTTAAPHFRRVLLERKVPRHDIVGMADGIGRAPRGVNDGSGLVFVSHTGRVYPSGFLPVDCGDVRDAGLARIYREHPLMVALRDPDGFGGKCGACEFRKVCGGSRARAHAMTGDALGSDPACAYVPRAWAEKPAERRAASPEAAAEGSARSL